ncbi:MAG: hydantoinase B/oxoprolinase family protein [Gammaproteobacteria bacterium]|nr:hydantoinase B/oxoprolinase family protein [Gammaproteobacteria bacterium]
MDAIALSIFASRINAVCEEMGAVLQSTALSPNIKDRLDFSCAVFDADGELCAQAAHIPVHLGSMAYAMSGIVSTLIWQAGDMVVVNDPYLGGTHLPDVTLIAPLFINDELIGFVTNRAHHADIGATTPGSMPISQSLDEEGVIIPPTFIVRAGVVDDVVLSDITSQSRNHFQSHGDYSAQLSANRCGVARLEALIKLMGITPFREALVALNDYAERLALSRLSQIPDGTYRFHDVMDDDGMGHKEIRIEVCIDAMQGRMHLDFSGTAKQVMGNINCPLSVAAAAVFYVFRCLMPAHTPACAGSFRPITLAIPQGTLLNACRPAAVAAGNVETSTRTVDVVMGALAQAIPDKIPAASHGSMNNVAMGGVQLRDGQQQAWDYYETIGGGMGAGALENGLSAVQTHMTNTRNTPIESLEMHYPLRLRRYAIRGGSGGAGLQKGGDGIIREYEFLADTIVTLLTERRFHAPWGLAGGEPGSVGINCLDNRTVDAKQCLEVRAGDRLTINTPGGGGWGKEE